MVVCACGGGGGGVCVVVRRGGAAAACVLLLLLNDTLRMYESYPAKQRKILGPNTTTLAGKPATSLGIHKFMISIESAAIFCH